MAARGKSSPVVEADPPTAVPATEAILPPVWRTTGPLPAGWLQPDRMPSPLPPDLVLAAAAHDAAEFRAEQTAEHAAQLRRELELNFIQQQAEVVEAKARAEDAKEKRQVAAQARHRTAVVTRQEARAAEATAKQEREATRAEEAKRDASQKKLRYEEARQRCRPPTEHRSIGTARLTTKLRTPSPPPHYASPRQNATNHVLRATPTTAAAVALARATLTAEGRTPVALTSSAVYRATSAPAQGQRGAPPEGSGGSKGGPADGATARTTDPTTLSSLPPTPRPKVGVLPASAPLALAATTAALAPRTRQVGNQRQRYGRKKADSSSAASMWRLPSADLARRTPSLGPWGEPAQSPDGGAFYLGAVAAAAEGSSDRARSVGPAPTPPPRTSAYSCSPRQLGIHGARRQYPVSGPPSPASVRASVAKRETATAAATATATAAVARGGRWHSRAASPRGPERFYMSSSVAQVEYVARSEGRRTAHANGRRIHVYATPVDTSPWLGDELEPAPAVAF